MPNIAGFKSSITNGLVRPNTFEVNLNFPGFVSGGTDATQLARFHCKAASLPESSVAPIPVFFQGRAVHVAGERSFQPWQVMIYNENFVIRDTLERWMHGINDLGTNGGIIQPALYQTDMRVIQLDRNGTELKEVKLINAFPIQIEPIQLDFENNNVVEVYSAVFVYDWYESSNVNV
jgi:hypothetical protein